MKRFFVNQPTGGAISHKMNKRWMAYKACAFVGLDNSLLNVTGKPGITCMTGDIVFYILCFVFAENLLSDTDSIRGEGSLG